MLVVDASQLIRWEGRLTGVPRVEYELITRFMAENQAVFVSWNRDGFYFIDIAEALRNREELGKSNEQPVNRPVDSPRANSAKRLVLRLPFAKRTLHYVRRMWQTRKGREESQHFEQYTFHEGDDFFIGQGLWNDDQYISAVVSMAHAGVKVFQVVYDMLPLLAPQYSGHSADWLQNYASAIYPVSRHILSISKHTSSDLKQWLVGQGLHVPMVSEIRLGDDFQFVEPVKPQQFSPNCAFILCVGTIEARKNHSLLYYVYKLAASRNIDMPRLVIVGRRGWHTENIVDLFLNDPQVNDKVRIIEGASDNELSWLYKNCRFTVYPSFYEGWGLPIAESMHYGKLCVVSNTSSMPEVAGDLAIYFNPASPDELLGIIERLMDDAELQTVQQTVKRYKGATWDETYKQVIATVREMQ